MERSLQAPLQVCNVFTLSVESVTFLHLYLWGRGKWSLQRGDHYGEVRVQYNTCHFSGRGGGGCNILVLKNVCNTIKIIKIETEIDRKDERFRTIFVTFYNKNVFFYMFVGRNQLAFVDRVAVLAVGIRFWGSCRYRARLKLWTSIEIKKWPLVEVQLYFQPCILSLRVCSRKVIKFSYPKLKSH